MEETQTPPTPKEGVQLEGLPQESFVMELPSGFKVSLSSNEQDLHTLISLAFASHKESLQPNGEKPKDGSRSGIS